MQAPELGMEELTAPESLKATLAEGIGTLIFVFIGVGSIAGLVATSDLGGGLLGPSIGHGLAIAIAVAATAHISGGYINPAVTFGAMLTGKLTLVRGLMYIVAQCVGAVVAALLLKWVLTGGLVDATNLGVHAINENTVESTFAGLVIEAVLTFALVRVVFAVAMDPRGNHVIAPLVIGFTILIIHLMAIPLTGAGVNPARSFGPALVQGDWHDHWVYWIGPLIGGATAALSYQLVQMPKEEG
jgi:aquaporin TIP